LIQGWQPLSASLDEVRFGCYVEIADGDGDRFAESRAVRFGSAAEAAHPVKANPPALLLALRTNRAEIYLRL
jgi:hypothetical protein